MAPRTTRTGASKSLAKSKSTKLETKSEEVGTTARDLDIFADPLSSDEDEKLDGLSADLPAARKIPQRSKFSPPKPVNSSASKAMNENQFSIPDLFDPDDFTSSQPKKKRKLDMYDKRNIQNSQEGHKLKANGGFVKPANMPGGEASAQGAEFKVPQMVDSLTRMSNRKSSKAVPFQASAAGPLRKLDTRAEPKFTMPETIAEPNSSATSAVESIFEAPDLPQETRPRRSGSTSSLSSHSSAELCLTLEEQMGMAHDDSGDGLDGVETTRCRLCSARVELSVYEDFVLKHRKMGIRQQQEFHTLHQQRQAQRTWQERDYPQIDWHDLEHRRVPDHIPLLTRMLRRRAPSFYRTKVDGVVHDAKASRKAVNHYLKDGVVDVAKQGYYGPRGARVMGHAITNAMLQELQAELLRDKVVRAVGVGGYVSCVLVPELMVELVKEDMHLKDNSQAMKILDDSADVGALLNGDDDERVHRTGSEDA